MSASQRPEDLELLRVLNDTKKEFPDFELTAKSQVWWMCAIDAVLRIITLGGMTKFLTRYTTTIGYTIYTGALWDSYPSLHKAAVIRHERVHMRQRKTLGAVWYELKYLLWPFPVLVATGRRSLEQEAYAESLAAYADYYGINVIYDSVVRKKIIDEFVGPSYFWMWPFRNSLEAWYDSVVEDLEKKHQQSNAEA